MKVDEKIKKRFSELIELGENVTRTKYSRSGEYIFIVSDDGINTELAHKWGTSSLSLLSRVFGKESDHYQKFNSLFSKFHDYTPITKALGILKAAKDDYENEMLFDTKVLIEADVFDDFLEQAEYLSNSGYYQPAAVIAGSVLEDGLRKLSERNGIEIHERPKLDKMNSELVKKGVYNKLTQKRITFIAEIRNKAAHGKWDEFSKEDVDDMINQIRSFMTNYLF